jgi:hypothetical protein
VSRPKALFAMLPTASVNDCAAIIFFSGSTQPCVVIVKTSSPLYIGQNDTTRTLDHSTATPPFHLLARPDVLSNRFLCIGAKRVVCSVARLHNPGATGPETSCGTEKCGSLSIMSGNQITLNQHRRRRNVPSLGAWYTRMSCSVLEIVKE